MFTIEPIEPKQELTQILDELLQAAVDKAGLPQARALMKRWKTMIAARTGFVLIAGGKCIGILLHSSEYELRFSSFLSDASAQSLPRNVTIWLCHVTNTDEISQAEDFLLKAAVTRLRADPSVETIAVQMPPLCEIDLERTLPAIGFMSCHRVRMERPLSGRKPGASSPPGCKLEIPSDKDAEDLMSVIHQGYFSEIDGYLFPDISAVCSDAALFKEFISSKTINLAASVLARVQGHPSGCIIALKGETFRNGLIGVVAVVPGMRRRGIGRAMILYVLRKFQEMRHEVASLAVTLENVPAVSLYRSLGFKETNRRTSISVWRRSVSRPLMNFRR